MVGTVIELGGANSIPSGYLLCNGQSASRNRYSELFAIVGTKYGKGDDVNTFGIPDLNTTTANALTTFSTSGNLPVGLKGHTVTKVGTNKYLAVGGYTAAGTYSAVCYLGTITAGVMTWTETTALPVAATAHSAVMLVDGRVLITGGQTAVSGAGLSSTATYLGTVGTDTVTWEAGTVLPESIAEHETVLLPDGQVILLGGYSAATSAAVKSVRRLTITKNNIAYTQLTDLPIALRNLGAVVVSAGQIGRVS